MIKKIWDWLVCQINNYEIKKKMYILYFFCMLIPLLITDGAILVTVIHADQNNKKQRLENTGSAVMYFINTTIENTATISKNIYVNAYINNFLEKNYNSPLEYYIAYQDFMRGSLFNSTIGGTNVKITMYADNPTLINGGEFARVDKISNTGWYDILKKSKMDMFLYVTYNQGLYSGSGKRKISFIRRLDYYKGSGCEKVLKLDLDYNQISENLEQMKYEAPVYICEGDNILFSNTEHSQIGSDFLTFKGADQAAIVKTMKFYGMEWKIYVMKSETDTWIQIKRFFPVLFILVILNIGLPWLFLQILNHSFTRRLWELSRAFDGVKEERLQEITNVRGKDELGSLMRNYNHMAKRINDLIETVYKERLREQEADIARQNAELLALHSQINPHFLFNALESIRMHSVLKNELETANIVEKLALMERQYVDWGTDFVKIKKEMEFVEAYLELQKYRFGDRLSYTLEIKEGLGDYWISKLTLITFVENACVHGIENKTAGGWIFVRVYEKGKQMYLEVEDTGRGMSEEKTKKLRHMMEQGKMEDLKKQSGVGMINACLRLKMMTQNQVRFELESEEGTGTIVTIRLPLEDITS